MTENSFKQEYLAILLRKWWLIVMITGSASIIALLIVLNQANLYEAQSRLLIVVPVGSRVVSTEEGAPEVNFPALSVETLTTLARSGDLLTDIINDLNLLDEATGNPLSVEALGAMMEASYESTGVGSQYVRLPILKITVKGENPKQLKDIADSWAKNFEKKNADLFTSETTKSFTFLDSQYNEAKNTYNTLLDDLTKYKKQYPIVLLTQTLTSSRNKFLEVNELLRDKTNELSLSKIELIAVNKEITDRSYNGEWVGFATESLINNQNISEQGTLDLLTRDSYFLNQKRYNEFINSNNITQRRNLLTQLQEQILTDTERLVIAEQQLVIASARKIELSKELLGQEQSILLVKAIDDATLRQQLGLDPNASTWNQIRDLGISTEEINEVYVSLSNELSTTNVLISGLTDEISNLKSLNLVNKKNALNLELELNNILLVELPNLEQRLLSSKSSYETELQRYNRTVERQKNLKYLVFDLNAQVQALMDSYDVNKESLEMDESNLLAAEVYIAKLEQEVSTIRASFEAIAEARQAARIAKSEQEGSIRIVESAIEPQIPVGPARRSTLIFTGTISLMLSVAMAFLLQYIQDSRIFSRKNS